MQSIASTASAARCECTTIVVEAVTGWTELMVVVWWCGGAAWYVNRLHPDMSALNLLFESSSGYALFEVVKAEEIGAMSEAVQETIQDLARFSKIVKLKSFLPFTSAESALENINAVSEGVVTPYLQNFIEMNLGEKSKKDDKTTDKSKVRLGIQDVKLATSISDAMRGVKCDNSELALELLRYVVGSRD